MVKKRKSKAHSPEYVDAELNIMPFIDVFSMLNIFLLVSASFLSIGIIKVQVPFLTNAPVPPEKSKRTLVVNTRIEKSKIILTTEYSQPPGNAPKDEEFTNDDSGLAALHTKLVSIRGNNPSTDLVTVFCEDDVTYEQITKLLDVIKIRKEGDPRFENKADEEDDSNDAEKAKLNEYLFPKVVMGSVLL